MKRSKRIIASVVAGMFCGAYKAEAQWAVSQNLAPVGSGTPVDGTPYGYTSSSTRAANGFDEITDVNTSYAVGFQKTYDSLGSLVWDTSLSLVTPIYIGFQADNSTYAQYGAYSNSALNYQANGFISGAPQSPDFYLLTSTGVVGGETTRNFITSTNTNTGRGTDAWIYTPGVNTLDGTNGYTGVYTPTIVNPQTSIADSNGDGITSYYFYTTASDNVNNIAGTIQAVNNSSQAVGTSTRYTGTSSSNLGTDAWITTPSLSTGSITLLGLGSGASTATSGYAYTAAAGIFRSSSPIPSGTVANNVGLIDQAAGTTNGGEAAGTTNRYDDATASGSSSSTAGVDSWVYVPGSTSGVTQIGLAGSGSAYEVAASGGLSTNVPYRYSKVTELNPSGQVAGSSWNFSGVTAGSISGTPNTSGWEAWVYTPSGTPTTSSTLGSNGYAQVGLIDLATGPYTTPSDIGHASTATLSTSTTYPNYTAFNGTTLYGTAAKGYNLVSGLSSTDSTGLPNTGIAAGVALRFDASGNTDLPSSPGINSGLGQDAWVATTSGTPVTTNVQPNALIAANPSNPSIVSYYQPVVTNTFSPTAKTVATVTTPTNGIPASSTYVNASQSASTGLNPGYAQMSVLGMNSTGLTVGSIARTDNGLNIGNDLWVYDPSLNKEFILAAPAVTGHPEAYGSVTYEGISNSGSVFGFYLTSNNTTITSSGTTGAYLFDWSEKTGLVTVDQLYTENNGTGTTISYLNLNNALAGTVPADLFANGLSNFQMFIDSAGNLYLDGNTSTTNSAATSGFNYGISNGAFEVVPEPTSGTILLLGAAGLLSRRRRRRA